MSLERSLKSALERSAGTVDPDVGAAYESVVGRHRRAARTRRVAYSVAVASLVVAGVRGAPRILDALRDKPTVPAGRDGSGEARAAYRRLSGTYTTTISERAGLVRTYHLAGRWTMRLTKAGDVHIDAPRAYVRTYGPPSTTGFELDGETLETNVLYHSGLGCESPGTYEWSSSNDRLDLVSVDDACPLRGPVLTSPWRRIATVR